MCLELTCLEDLYEPLDHPSLQEYRQQVPVALAQHGQTHDRRRQRLCLVAAGGVVVDRRSRVLSSSLCRGGIDVVCVDKGAEGQQDSCSTVDGQ